jgi:hypothetical protein
MWTMSRKVEAVWPPLCRRLQHGTVLAGTEELAAVAAAIATAEQAMGATTAAKRTTSLS